VRKGIACVVFDIDDTLYLEREYVRSGLAEVGAWVDEEFGLVGFFERCWDAFSSGVRGQIFDFALAAYEDVDPGLVGRLVERYRAHPPAISLLPDADDALLRLSQPYRLAALSDGPLVSQRAKVRALGLVGRLDPIILTDDLGAGHGKPDLEGFHKIEDRVGCAGSACCYVADNPSKDFAGPAELGWWTIRVRRAEGLHHDDASGPDVDLEVSDLGSLDAILPDLSAARVVPS
jgi:putative hydrolase of the HAD superfamily